MTVAQVVKDLTENLIPDTVVIPAMVGEVTRAQMAGYALVIVPVFRP